MKTPNQTGIKALLLSCSAILATQLTVSAQTLVHRYSFNDPDNGTGNVGATIADSVGGPTWNGTLPNGGDLTSYPGQVFLQSGAQQYVNLPAGILSNYTSVTIDAWATTYTLPTYCFFFGFGNTDGGGAGETYIFGSLARQYAAITGADPGYTAEQGTAGGANLSNVSIHFTAVYNPPGGYVALYTNGVLQSINTGVTTPLSAVNNVFSYIGKSLYNGDPYGDIQVDEFRVWNGSLNSLQIAGGDVAGPDTVSTSSGTVTNVTLQVADYQITQGGNETPVVFGQATLVPYPVDISQLATLTSANTNIIQINSTNHSIVAVGQGSTTITATYGTVSASQVITVVQPISVLTHRYSFSDKDDGNGNVGASIADSVGGAAWNGTLPNGGTLTGSQLQLLAANSQYVQLPSGIISNYSAVTLEAWATFPSTLPGACFFFGFGNTDAAGLGQNYIYLQPSSGHIGITGNDPGYNGEQQAGTYGNLSLQTNLHITAVFNPQASWIAVYTNGILAGKNTAVTWRLSQVSSVLNYLAKSLYNGDSPMDVNFDEFRIYQGALTGQGIAISGNAGPNSVPAAVTNGPGALLSLSINVPATLQPFQKGKLALLANYTSLSNWDIIGNSIFPPAGLTISTSDTNVLTYGTDGYLHGINPGVASVITVYQGITNTATVTVAQPPVPTLVNRYSFSDKDDGAGNLGATITDSVGGPAWNGTLPNGGTLTGTQCQLLAASQQYVNLPGGILSNYTAVTIDTWATSGTLPTYCFYFGFGNTDSGSGLGDYYIFGSLARQYAAITGVDPGYTGEQGTAGGPNLSNVSIHFTAVYNPPGGYVALYTNGVLQSINTSVTTPMSAIQNVYSYIGHSLYNGDPYGDITMDEFRIYNGVLSPNDVLASQALGPNALLASTVNLSATESGKNVVLSWPVGAGAYSVQAKSSLTSGTWKTIASPLPQLVGNQWQLTLPESGGTWFFRLAR